MIKDKIIKVKDVLYLIVGKMHVDDTVNLGTDYWKKCYNADSLLRNGMEYYFCRIILDAEFEDV